MELISLTLNFGYIIFNFVQLINNLIYLNLISAKFSSHNKDLNDHKTHTLIYTTLIS